MDSKNEIRETFLTLRITREEQARLADVARQRGVNVAAIVRERLGPIFAGAIEAPAGAGQAMQTTR